MSDYNSIEISDFERFLEVLAELNPHKPTLIVNTAHNTTAEFEKSLRDAEGLVTDFDGTLQSGNQWRDVRALMTLEHQEKSEKDLQDYLEGRMPSDKDKIDFIFRTVERVIGEVRIHDLCDRSSLLLPRPGAAQFVGSFASKNIIIVSFGLRDYIEHWQKHFLKESVEVSALSLIHNEDIIVGYDSKTVVTDHNKGEISESFQKRRDLDSAKTVVLGDAPTDIQMMHSENIAILIVPRVDPDNGRMEFRMRGLENMWPKVSAVLVSDCLTPLVQIRNGS